ELERSEAPERAGDCPRERARELERSEAPERAGDCPRGRARELERSEAPERAGDCPSGRARELERSEAPERAGEAREPASSMTDDERFMQRALDVAARARGLTSPNPMVGAVVVREGTMIAEGFHRAAGEPHAEIEALSVAGGAARGATLYSTLEPCVHHGRTPPCAPAVIAAGVRRVVIATTDPNPVVSGRGVDTLRAAGIDVVTGVLAAHAAALNRIFLTAMRERRPHVTLKAAMTLDGKIADTHGTARWITGERARAHAHRLRSEADAIVVGVATVLRDDPELTVRLDAPWPREPYRVA